MTETLATVPQAPSNDRRLAGWALAVAAALLPFLSELPIDFDRLAPLAVLPAVWLGRNLGGAATGNLRADKTGRWLLTLAIGAALASAALSHHPISALVHTATLAWILAGAFLARRLSQDEFALRLVLGGITLGATLGCLAVWIGWKDGTPISAFPFYGHGRLFGLHLMIGTMTALAWLSITTEKTVERHAVTIVAILNCGGMLWSGGRAPLLGFFAGALAWGCALGAGRRRTFAQRLGIVFAGGLLLSLLRWSPEPYLGWWGAIARSAAATSVDELSSTRLSFWQVTWQEFLQAPWIGHGADAYRFIQPKQDGSQPHNWVLQLLLDFGLPGGVAVGTLFVRQAWLGFRGSSEAAPENSVRCAAAAGSVACLSAGLLDGVFYHAVLLVPASLLAGIAGGVASGERTEDGPRQPRLIRGASGLALTAATALLVAHSSVVGLLLTGSPPATPEEPAARWVRTFPSSTFGITRWLNLWRTTRPDDAIAWAKWAQRYSDNPAELHVYVAVIYANRGDFSAAASEVGQALQKCHIRTRPKLVELQNAIAAAKMQAAAAAPNQ